VISLFNGTIPLIAIQMQALRIGEMVMLVFTTVMDELSRGLVDEDEDAAAAPTDRAYWEKRSSKSSMALADELLQVIKEFDASLELKYNKFYIGLSREGQAFNFVELKPQKNLLRLELALPQTDDLDALVDAAGFDAMEYDKRWRHYRLRLTKPDIGSKAEALRELMKLAYERRSAM
jgi:hypothetical protein